MVEFDLDTISNNVPYLLKYSSIPSGTISSSCTTICETVDDCTNDRQSEQNHDTQRSLMDENEFPTSNYKCVSEYGDVYNSGIINNIENYENGNIMMDYRNNTSINYYTNSLNGYSNNSFNEHDENKIDDYNVNYNSDFVHKYDINEYNIRDRDYTTSENDYDSKLSNFNVDAYKNSETDYNTDKYYHNDPNFKYNMFNMSNFSNPDSTIDHNQMDINNNVPFTNCYNIPMPVSSTINQNAMVSSYGNSNGGENVYDLGNYNNLNCISGVKYQRTDNRWIARWTTAEGKRACKSFSVNIYGFNRAKMLAIQARQKGVALSGRSFCNRERQHAMKSGVGIIGIRFDKTQARWVSSYYEGGKRKFRYFTVKDYGYEQAKRNAILWKSCHDERLVKRMKEGYGMNYTVPNKLLPNIMYPVDFTGNDNNYMVDNAKLGNYFNNNDYIDMGNENQYTNEYQNVSNYQNINSYKMKEGYSNVMNPNFTGGYEQLYCKNNPDYQASYNTSYQNTANDYGDIVNYRNLSNDESTNPSLNNSSNFDKENDKSTLSSNNIARIGYISEIGDNIEDEETTGIESDNGDHKVNRPTEYDCNFDTDERKEGNISNHEDKNSPFEISYDRKKGRWTCSFIGSDGQRVRETFPVHKYGYKRAKQMALSAKERFNQMEVYS